MTGTAAYILASAKVGTITNTSKTETVGNVWTATADGAEWKKSLTTIYEAGDGIEIIGDVAVSDTLPVKLYGNSSVLSQYIVQGAEGGVGDYKSQYGTYDFMIQVQAGEDVAAFKVGLPSPLYEDSYVDFQKQALVSKKTKITVTKQTQTFDEAYYLAANGAKEYYWNWRREYIGVVSNIPVIENHQYSLLVTAPKQTLDINEFYHCWYDVNGNFISAFKPLKDNVQLVVAPQGACYLSLTVDVDMHDFGAVTLYDLTPRTTPIELPQVAFFPDIINTITITSTVQPSKVMFEVDTSESSAGDETGVRVIGKVYNRRRVLTQAEYDALSTSEKTNGTLYLIEE